MYRSRASSARFTKASNVVRPLPVCSVKPALKVFRRPSRLICLFSNELVRTSFKPVGGSFTPCSNFLICKSCNSVFSILFFNFLLRAFSSALTFSLDSSSEISLVRCACKFLTRCGDCPANLIISSSKSLSCFCSASVSVLREPKNSPRCRRYIGSVKDSKAWFLSTAVSATETFCSGYLASNSRDTRVSAALVKRRSSLRVVSSSSVLPSVLASCLSNSSSLACKLARSRLNLVLSSSLVCSTIPRCVRASDTVGCLLIVSSKRSSSKSAYVSRPTLRNVVKLFNRTSFLTASRPSLVILPRLSNNLSLSSNTASVVSFCLALVSCQAFSILSKTSKALTGSVTSGKPKALAI